MKISAIFLLLVINSLLFLPLPVAASLDDVTVADVSLSKKTLRGRTAYYSYKITVSNAGSGLTQVTATVSSKSRAIRVTERSLTIGDIAAGSSQQSSDTFTIRVSSSVNPDLSQLIYTFNGEAAPSQDTQPPTIIASLSAPANENGWHNQAVTVTFSCTDNVAIASCTQPTTINIDGAEQIVQGSAVDTAGNASSTQVSINLDTQAPALSAELSPGFDTPPIDNASLLQRVAMAITSEPNTSIEILQQSPVNLVLGPLTTDNNGQASLPSIDLAPGDNSFVVNAQDIAGNVSTTNLVLNRAQCFSEPANQPFYLTSMLTLGDSLNLLRPEHEDFIGHYEQFSGDAQSLIQVVPGFINDDLYPDWVLLDGAQTGVVVLINSGLGSYQGGYIKLTGSSAPTFAVLANLVGSQAVDLAIGHSDGLVAIFAGNGDGSFSETAISTFTHAEAINTLQATDLDNDGDTDLLVLTPTTLLTYLRVDSSTAQSVITNGDFTNGLVGWQVSVVGHQANQVAGRVAKSGSGAQLFENESFLISLKQKFTPSTSQSVLSFSLLSVALDPADGGIQDAIEVSLLDANNQSVIPTFRPEASSFLNITADGEVRAASGVTYSGGNVELDISSVNNPVTLYFDLIGNPPATNSTYVVSKVDAGQSLVINNDYSSRTIDGSLISAKGAVFCDALADPLIMLADPGRAAVQLYSQDASGNYVSSTTLDQGGE